MLKGSYFWLFIFIALISSCVVSVCKAWFVLGVPLRIFSKSHFSCCIIFNWQEAKPQTPGIWGVCSCSWKGSRIALLCGCGLSDCRLLIFRKKVKVRISEPQTAWLEVQSLWNTIGIWLFLAVWGHEISREWRFLLKSGKHPSRVLARAVEIMLLSFICAMLSSNFALHRAKILCVCVCPRPLPIRKYSVCTGAENVFSCISANRQVL